MQLAVWWLRLGIEIERSPNPSRRSWGIASGSSVHPVMV